MNKKKRTFLASVWEIFKGFGPRPRQYFLELIKLGSAMERATRHAKSTLTFCKRVAERRERLDALWDSLDKTSDDRRIIEILKEIDEILKTPI